MTPTQRAAALRLIEFETLPRRLLDIACRVRVNECLFHDDEFVDDASHALKEAIDLLRELAAEPVQKPVAWMAESKSGTARFTNIGQSADELESLGWAIVPLYAAPQQPMRCPEDGGACGAGGYCRPEPQQRKPLTRSMQAEIECDCLVAWNASTYGHSKQDTVHPMFLSAFILGYWTAERAHGITGAPT